VSVVAARPAARGVDSFISLTSRGDEWQRRLAMVAAARRFLYLATYFYHPDRYGREMADALLAAAGRGVDVWLVVDGFGQRLAGALMSRAERAAARRLWPTLAAAGVHVCRYTPRPPLQRLLGGGYHIKVQVSEAGEAIFASGNISATSFEGWNEYACAVRGPVVRPMLASVMAAIDHPEHGHLDAVGPPEPGATATRYVAHLPCDDPSPVSPFRQRRPNPVTDALIALIDRAEQRLVITSFYFKPAPSLLDAVVRATRRGVRVEIIHSHRDALPASPAPWLAATFTYSRLLDAGVAIYERRGGEHSKILVADGREAAVGTYNLEWAAHDRLAESMLLTREPTIVAGLDAVVEAIRAHPQVEPFTAADLAALPLLLKLRRVLLYPVRRWF